MSAICPRRNFKTLVLHFLHLCTIRGSNSCVSKTQKYDAAKTTTDWS